MSHRMTFEIRGPRITAEQFRTGFDAYLNIITEVTYQVTGKKHAVDWILSVEPGSVRVHMDPEPRSVEPRHLDPAIKAIRGGFRSLESGTANGWPEHFTERALRFTKKMLSIVSDEKGHVSGLCLRFDQEEERLSSRSTASVDALLQSNYTATGSIEGFMQVISKRGQHSFSVDDDVTGGNVNCYFPKEMLNNVLDSFKESQRVSVSGEIAYRRDGKPIRIQVETFTVFPAPADLPTFDDVIGIFNR